MPGMVAHTSMPHMDSRGRRLCAFKGSRSTEGQPETKQDPVSKTLLIFENNNDIWFVCLFVCNHALLLIIEFMTHSSILELPGLSCVLELLVKSLLHTGDASLSSILDWLVSPPDWTG